MSTTKTGTLWTAILGLALLAGACSPIPVPSTPTAAVPPATSGSSFAYEGVSLALDAALASGASGQVVPEKPAGADSPWYDVNPQYVRLALEGYPVAKSANTPLIAVYPVQDYRRLSQQAGKVLDDLAQYLAEKPADGREVPALPLRNDKQSFRSNVKFLSFQNGSGVRFLAFYAQGPVPVNNRELFYAFQGLTADGNSIVTAVLPVNAPDLPADASALSPAEIEQLFQDPQYLQNLSAKLGAQADGNFTPDLSKLDALIASLKIGK